MDFDFTQLEYLTFFPYLLSSKSVSGLIRLISLAIFSSSSASDL